MLDYVKNNIGKVIAALAVVVVSVFVFIYFYDQTAQAIITTYLFNQ
jgi:hypothetical protein